MKAEEYKIRPECNSPAYDNSFYLNKHIDYLESQLEKRDKEIERLTYLNKINSRITSKTKEEAKQSSTPLNSGFKTNIEPKNNDQKMFYAFDSSKKQLKPSTMGTLDIEKLVVGSITGKTKKIKETTNIHLELSGYFAKEMFVFNLYNTINDGTLALKGTYNLIPQGKKTEETTEATEEVVE